MSDQESGMRHENPTARTDTDLDPGPVGERDVQAPSLRVRARRSAVRLLLRRGAFASAIALAALVVSYHYGGFLGTSKHRAVPEILAISGTVVFLLSAVIAVRCATNDVLGLLYTPGRLSDARASTLRLLCLLCGYTLVVLGALSLLHVPVERLLLGGVLTRGHPGHRGAGGAREPHPRLTSTRPTKRRGAGMIPALSRIAHTVDGAT
jgi:hypothetical protein